MFAKGFLRYVLIALPLGGVNPSNSVWAVDPPPNAVVADIALGEGGRLEGQVADSQGNGLSNVLVALRTSNYDSVTTTTTDYGRFAFQGVPGGVYLLSAGNADYAVRAWAPQTAPPAAHTQAVLYVQNEAADPGAPNRPAPPGMPNDPAPGRNLGLRAILGNPLIITAGIATAVALPIVLSRSHRPASP
jgi:hypothetical protein